MAVGSERQSGSFLEQDSTAVPKFAYRSFCPCGNLVGECLPQTLPCGLRRLSRRSHAAVERRFYHAKTIQHTAPQPGSQNTHDRGRIRRVYPAAFCLQHEPSRVYSASHNRGIHTPHHNRFPRQRRAACRRREADRRIRKNRRQLKPDSPDAERVAQPLPAACRGGTGGGFRPCCPKV